MTVSYTHLDVYKRQSSNSENQSFTDLAVRRLNKPLNSDRISLFGRHNKLNNEVTKLPVLNMVTENYQNLLNEQTTGTVPTVNQSATRSETLNVLSSEKLLTAKSGLLFDLYLFNLNSFC